ncbi:retrotransposon protein, putative, ty1-copia subclass [Tanacetum coccineum]
MNLKRTRNFKENEIDKDIISTEMVSILPLPILHITQTSDYSQFLGGKDSPVLTIWTGCETLGKAAKGKFDRGSKRKAESEIAPTSDPKEAVCFCCNTKGHWKRSCPKYLKDLKDGKVKKGSHSSSPCKGIYETVESISHNGNVILNVGSSNDLDKSKLWHSCLGHELLCIESDDEEPIVNTDTQQEVVTPVKPDDISLPIHRISDESANYMEAMSSPEAAKGKEAKKSEIQSMYDNQVLNLVDTTPGLKMVGCKWIFKKKIDMDEKLHTYKARLMYVKTDFLNEKLTEDVFMAQPEGFENAKYPKRVCKLQKAIYGLKQASLSGSVVVFLILYVDDILLIGNDIPTLQSVKDWLGKCFAMKDLEDAAYILGIKIYRDRSKRLIGLSQDTKDLSSKTDKELNRMSRVPYASAVGSIMYAMTCTRPDVSFALSMVSRHHQNPEEELKVTSYYDASWKTDKDDSRSQSGWVFLLNGGAVTWKSSKKDIVTDSTCESEYIAACKASKEAIWMKNFIGDLGVVPTVQDPIEIFFDNESVVALTKEPKDHEKSKYIEIKYHFVRSKVEEGHVIMKHIRSEDNPADPSTKALAKSRHDEHARSIGLKDNIKF